MGDLLFVTPKFKETNLDTINIFPYTYDKQNLKIIPWPLEKCLKCDGLGKQYQFANYQGNPMD